MHSSLHKRFVDTLHSAKEILAGSVIHPILMPHHVVVEPRLSKSTASTPSLRSRDGLPHHIMSNTKGGNVKVVVRVRSFLPRETAQNSQCIVSMPNMQTTILNIPPNDPRRRQPHVFTFDRSYWSHNSEDDHYATQEDMYDELGEEFLNHNFEGFNTCIFAYGQTGAGKSYTMMGGAGVHRGLIPRTCEDMFERIAQHKKEHPDVTYMVHVSYFEVYNELIFDLLDRSGNRKSLKTRLNCVKNQVIVEDLKQVKVDCYDDILEQMKVGSKNRTTGSTKMNATSSRSHAVFTIELKSTEVLRDGTSEEIESRIRLVDLAGSERAARTGATGKQLQEGAKINLSLSNLGRVIKQLSTNASIRKNGRGQPNMVPYRDSVLTHILKDSLGGNSKTAVVACVSPTDFEETLGTLRFARAAKNIETVARANHDTKSKEERDAQIATMAEQIRRLQHDVSEGASLRERSVQEHERSIREQESRLEQYRDQVASLTRAMSEKSAIDETRIKRLETENEALKTHLHLAIKTLNDPIRLKPTHSSAEKEEDDAKAQEGEAGVGGDEGEEAFDDEAFYEQSDDDRSAFGASPFDPYADDLNDVMAELIRDVKLFRRRLCDDLQRYPGLQGSMTSGGEALPIGVSVM